MTPPSPPTRNDAARPPADGDEIAGDLVTLAAAAEALDVHYMTAYRYVRTGRMHAEKRGGKWWVAQADLAAVVSEGTGRRPKRSGESCDRASLIEPFTKRLTVGDTAGCWDLIADALASGAMPADIHNEVLQPSLEQIGESWRNGEISVAEEHRATATVYRLLGQLGPMFRHRGRRRGTVIVGTVEGDMHAIPTAIMADLLSDRRFDVVDLGANTPAESFLQAAAEVDDLVGIGVCAVQDESVDTALSAVITLRSELPDAFLVAGGSPTFGRAAEFEGHVDVVSDSAVHACDAFEVSWSSSGRSPVLDQDEAGA